MQNTSVAEIAASARSGTRKITMKRCSSYKYMNILIHILNKRIRHSFQVKAFHPTLIRCVILVTLAYQK